MSAYPKGQLKNEVQPGSGPCPPPWLGIAGPRKKLMAATVYNSQAMEAFFSFPLVHLLCMVTMAFQPFQIVF